MKTKIAFHLAMLVTMAFKDGRTSDDFEARFAKETKKSQSV